MLRRIAFTVVLVPWVVLVTLPCAVALVIAEFFYWLYTGKESFWFFDSPLQRLAHLPWIMLKGK